MQLGLPFTYRPSGFSRTLQPASGSGRVDLVFVRHPKARRYILRVGPDGSVRVTVPRRGSKREAARFAERESGWIERERARLRAGGDDRQTESTAVDRDALARARRELPARLVELAAQHGLTVSRVSIRNQRWRWGSCSPAGHICLNWRLVDMPPSVRDYVLIHELMHLKRLDHSPRFWKLVAAACPDYRAARAFLRTYRRV
jgi:predicted metal-dependent hydrolase